MAAASLASSYAIARSTDGSPARDANPAPSTPAQNPATRPQISSLLSICLVAGEAEQVATVVDELVHVGAGDERRGSLVHPDHVDQQQQGEGEQCPRRDLAERDGGRMDGLGQRRAR